LTQQPAASVPCVFIRRSAIGLQIVGPSRHDHRVLRAHAFESARPFQFIDAPQQN